MLMDRLNINYIRECNDINKLFNIITMEYTIDIMKAENKYYLESSLIKLQNDSILFEDSKEKSESSSFKKHIKGIFQAIVNFIENTLESIKELFRKKKNITIDDYMNSTSGQIKIDKDIESIYSNIKLCEENSSKYYPPNMSKSIDSSGKKKTKTTRRRKRG